MGEKHVARKGTAALVGMSIGRNDDLTNRMVQVVPVVAGDAVPLGFVPPDDDRTVVLVGLGGHDDGNDLLQEEVALQDIRGVAGLTFEPAVQRGVLIIVLVRRNPVVVGHGVVGQIGEQLLQRSVVVGQRICRCRIVAAVAVGEVHLRIVLRGIVKLVRAVELI